MGANHPVYQTWLNMMARCANPKARGYAYYGGRGVKVCRRWQSYRKFKSDMGGRYRKGLTLERRDGTKGYNPQNCCWAPWRTQRRNKPNNVWVKLKGRRMLQAEACRIVGLNPAIVVKRRKRGWPSKLWFTPSARC